MRILLIAFIATAAIFIPAQAQTVTRTTTVTQNISCPNWTNYRPSDISFTTADFPTNTLIADVNVIIDFDGRDGDEMNFMLYSENGAGTESTSLVDGNEGGENCAGSSFAETSATSVSRRTITFDEDAANFADGTVPANGSTVNSTCSNLDFEKWETMELTTTTDWWLRVGMAPNCTGGSGQTTIFSFGVQITGCKYASYGSATASRTVICVGGNSVLSHNGGVNTIDAQGFGDQLRWYAGSCGGTLVGTGNNLTVSPTSTTTYYAQYWIDGEPCGGGSTSGCASVTVNVVPDPSVSASGGGTICVGGNRTLSASTSGGTGTCTYQWQVSTSGTGGPWSNISGATGSTYNTGSLTATRYYRVRRICNGSGCGDPYSNAVTVNVVSDPTISASGSTTICSGGNRTISTSTSGGVSCSYQWQVSTAGSGGPWSVISGATGSSYNTGSLTSTRWYRVRRICTGSGCSDPYSNVITINVVSDPTISASGSTTICSGGNQNISTSTSGGVSCTYQWQVSTAGSGGPWSVISGATGSSYNTGSLTSTRWYRVRRICSGSGCSDPYSNIITVTVVPDPTISISGAGTVCVGGNRTLSSSTSGGTGSCSFQWQVSTSGSGGPWSNISGATGSSYNTGALSATRWYRVRRVCSGNGCNDPYSNVLTVTVIPDPTISASGGGTICVGGNRTLSTSTSGGVTCSYQWQVSTAGSGGPWSVISGATGSSYNTGALTATRWYRVRRICTGSGCSDPYSNVVTINVDANPSTANAGSVQTICSTTTALAANTPAVGVGTWTLVSGSGSITNPNSPTSTVTGLGIGSNTFRWTISNGVCPDSFDEVVITRDQQPIVNNATSTADLCEGSTRSLTGSITGPGTGVFSILAGSGSITGGNTYNTGSITSNELVTIRYTVTNGACTVFEDVSFNVFAQPQITSFALFTAPICEGDNSKTMAGLFSGTSGAGSSGFSVVAGSGTISSFTYFTGNITADEVVTIRYTATNGPCSTFADSSFTVFAEPSTADAGNDTEGCIDAAITLSAVAPTVGTGTWTWSPSVPSYVGGTSANDHDAQVVFSTGGTYTGTWTVSNGACPSSADDVIIDIYSSANNVVLATGTAVAVEVCEETPWTYYATPANPDEYVFAIDKNGSTFDAEVTITDVPGTAPIESLGGLPLLRGTWLISRYWDVNVTSGSVTTPVSVRYFVDPAEITDAQNAANAFVGSHPLASTITPLTWFKTPNGQTFNPSTDLINGDFTFAPIYLTPSSSGTINGVFYVEFGGLTGFSGGTGGFSVNDDNSPLPVELLYFEANVIENQYIRLDWATATEVNNDGFEVLRSTDGSNFERIAWVPGNGNSTVVNEYSYNDNDVVKGQTYYYQLRQVDYDGQSELFNIVSAKLSSNDQFVIGNLIPNPSKENDVVSVNVQASITADEVVTIQVYNHVGAKVAHEVHTLTNGENTLEVNINELASGTYFMNFESSFGIETRKLVVIR